MLKIYYQTTCTTLLIVLIMYHENISAQPMASGYLPDTKNIFSLNQSESGKISDLLPQLFPYTDTSKRRAFLTAIKNHPSGYIEAAGWWGNSNQPMAAGFTWSSQLSQTIAGVPLTVNASLFVNSLNPLNKISNGNISFDREQFLANLREKLEEHLKKEYQPVVNTLNQITATLKNYDSIRALLNDKRYLQVLKDEQACFDSIHQRIDSSYLSLADTSDLSRISDIEKTIENYENLSLCYEKMTDTVKFILDKYGSLDLREISRKLSLPIDPSELNEDQLLAEIRTYGITKLDQLFSGLKEFSIGELNIDQTPLTLNQKIANGLNISYALNKCYFHLIHAHEQLNPPTEFLYETALLNNIKQSRLISQATIGIGDATINFIQASISCMHNGNKVSTNQISLPNDNIVFALSTGVSDERGFNFAAETAASLSKYFPSYPATGIINNENVFKRTAFRILINKNIDQTHTSINMEFQDVGPWFKDEGNSYLTSDSRMLKGQISQKLMGNKLSLNGRWHFMQYNRSAIFQLPFHSLNYAVSAEYNLRNGNVSIQYNPIVNSLPGMPTQSGLQVFQGSLFKNYRILKRQFSTSIAISNYRLQQLQNAEYSGDSISNSIRFDCTQGIKLAENLSLNAIISFQTSLSDPGAINYALYEATINYEWKGCKLTGTFLFTQLEQSRYPGGGLNATVSLWKQARVAIQYSCQFFNAQNGILSQGSVTCTQKF